MQQQLLVQEQKFDKLWKILDDCINTGRYKQCIGGLETKDGRRCVMGTFLSYNGYTRGYTDILLRLVEQYNGTFTGVIPEGRDYQYLSKKLIENYMKTGSISFDILMRMNDMGCSFEQMRDMLKEIGV